MTGKIIELIELSSGKMRCKVCGAEHYAQIKPSTNGKLYRGNWQCQNGCK